MPSYRKVFKYQLLPALCSNLSGAVVAMQLVRKSQRWQLEHCDCCVLSSTWTGRSLFMNEKFCHPECALSASFHWKLRCHSPPCRCTNCRFREGPDQGDLQISVEKGDISTWKYMPANTTLLSRLLRLYMSNTKTFFSISCWLQFHTLVILLCEQRFCLEQLSQGIVPQLLWAACSRGDIELFSCHFRWFGLLCLC